VRETEERTRTHSFEIEVLDHHTREKKQVFVYDVPIGIDAQALAEMPQRFEREE
jgi:hypothetical protein